MRYPRRATCAIGLVVALATAGFAALPTPRAEAAAGPTATAPAQFYGSPWGGAPFWPGGFGYFTPDFGPPYAGSPGYPYYRYGAYYGNGFGFAYPIYPSSGAYYGSTYGTSYPYYTSAGGVSFGGDSGFGYFTPLGRCLYSASAGYGGSWSDPLSYGYLAPFC
jgi:hypothetical protein